MFGMVLERFNTVLKESLQNNSSKGSTAPIIILGGEVVPNNIEMHHGKSNRRSRTSLSDDGKKEKYVLFFQICVFFF